MKKVNIPSFNQGVEDSNTKHEFSCKVVYWGSAKRHIILVTDVDLLHALHTVEVHSPIHLLVLPWNLEMWLPLPRQLH
jgi:hypothetical protein